MGIGTADETAFAFEGRWSEFLPIAFTNMLLTIATLGIYRFWATTRERSYLWSRTRFIDDHIEWTGRGIELFFGFLIALALFGLPLLILNFFIQALVLQGYAKLAGAIGVFLYLFLFYLIGLAIFRGLRYRLSRTSWHGIHGGSDDPGVLYGISYLWKNGISYLLLGLPIPWAMTSLWKDRWEEMSFGPHRFVSNPHWGGLMKRYLLAWFTPWVMLILIVVLIGASMAGIMARPDSGAAPPVAMIVGLSLIVLLGFYVVVPLVALVYYSAYMREVIGTMSLSTLAFDFTARTKNWIWLFVGNAGIYILAFAVAAIPIAALGLFQQFGDLQPGEQPFAANPIAYVAFIIALIIPFTLVGPFIRYRNWRFFISHMEASGEVNLGDLTQSSTRDLKQGEGLLDAFDMGAV